MVNIQQLNISGGNNQFNEGNGTMDINNPQTFASIEKEFEAFSANNTMTASEKDAILPIIQELDKAAKENPDKTKKAGTATWFEKITIAFKALDGVANIATIATAPWWSPLKTLITNFIARL